MLVITKKKKQKQNEKVLFKIISFSCEKNCLINLYSFLHKAEMKPISCKDAGLLILVFGSRQEAHRRWWHTGTVVQKVNLLDEVEGIWRAFTRILSYLYTNIIYIKYNIKIAIFFFSLWSYPRHFSSKPHPLQTMSAS